MSNTKLGKDSTVSSRMKRFFISALFLSVFCGLPAMFPAYAAEYYSPEPILVSPTGPSNPSSSASSSANMPPSGETQTSAPGVSNPPQGGSVDVASTTPALSPLVAASTASTTVAPSSTPSSDATVSVSAAWTPQSNPAINFRINSMVPATSTPGIVPRIMTKIFRGVGSKFQRLIAPLPPPDTFPRGNVLFVEISGSSSAGISSSTMVASSSESLEKAAESAQVLEHSAQNFKNATEPITTKIKEVIMKILSIFEW